MNLSVPSYRKKTCLCWKSASAAVRKTVWRSVLAPPRNRRLPARARKLLPRAVRLRWAFEGRDPPRPTTLRTTRTFDRSRKINAINSRRGPCPESLPWNWNRLYSGPLVSAAISTRAFTSTWFKSISRIF